jgi:putative oxidoreductase
MNSLTVTLDRWSPTILSILRIMTGLLFFSSGLQKWFGLPNPNPNFANIQLLSLYGIAGIIEFVFGGLLTVGLFTRLAAFIMSGEMAVAYFMNRPPKGFAPITNGGTLEVLFCFVFFYFVFAGAGPLSIDAIMRKKN